MSSDMSFFHLVSGASVVVHGQTDRATAEATAAELAVHGVDVAVADRFNDFLDHDLPPPQRVAGSPHCGR